MHAIRMHNFGTVCKPYVCIHSIELLCIHTLISTKQAGSSYNHVLPVISTYNYVSNPSNQKRLSLAISVLLFQ